MSKPQRVLTPGLEEAVLSLYSRQRMSIRRVSVILDVDSQSIRRVLTKHNVQTRGSGYSPDYGRPALAKITADQYQFLLQDLKAGKRHSPLARKYGVSRERIRQIAKAEKMPTGKVLQQRESELKKIDVRATKQLQRQLQRDYRIKQIQQMGELWRNGWAVPNIAKALNLRPESVAVRISTLRRRFPSWFPYRHPGWATGKAVRQEALDLKNVIRIEDMSAEWL